MITESVTNTNNTETDVRDPLVELIDEFTDVKNVIFHRPSGENYVTLGIRENMNEGNLISKSGLLPYDGFERDIILNKGAFSWVKLSELAGVKDLDSVDYEVVSETDKMKKINIVEVNEQADRKLLLEAEIDKTCDGLRSFDESDDAALYNSMVSAIDKEFTYVCSDNHDCVVFGINMSNYKIPDKIDSVLFYDTIVDDPKVFDLPCFVCYLNSHEIDLGIMDGNTGKYIFFVQDISDFISKNNARILRHKGRECLLAYNKTINNINNNHN